MGKGRAMEDKNLALLKTALTTACSMKTVIEDYERRKKGLLSVVAQDVVPVLTSPFFYFILLTAIIIAFALGYTIKDLTRHE